MSVSSSPSTKPPTTAPVKLPRPPITAAMTAFSNQSEPMLGSAAGERMRMRQAATPASSPAKANAPEMTRLARTPISRAASKSSAAPRTLMPNSVRLNTTAVSASVAAVTAMVTTSITSKLTPATLNWLNTHAGFGKARCLGETKICHNACDSRSSAKEVSSNVNGLALRTQRNATSSVATEASTALPMMTNGIHHQLPPCRKKKYEA